MMYDTWISRSELRVFLGVVQPAQNAVLRMTSSFRTNKKSGQQVGRFDLI